MKNLIYIITLTVLISACGKTDDKINDKTNEQSQDQIDTQPSDNQFSSLDNIDRANEESVINAGENITKAYVISSDSSINLTANIKADHRIFGYEKPDKNSKRLLLISVFTNDVEGNPFGLELGAYYDTGSMDNLKLKYEETVGDFVKASAIGNNKVTTIYFEKKWIAFD
jgi:hypothetical protein